MPLAEGLIRTWVESGLQCGQTVVLEHVKKGLLENKEGPKQGGQGQLAFKLCFEERR